MGILYDAVHDDEKYNQLKNELENIAFDYATLPDLQIRNQNEEVRQALLDDAIDIGEIREPDSGFWGELKDDFLLSSNRAMRGIANTFGSEDGVKYFDEVLEDNPRWLPPEERGALGSIGGAIGSGLGSTAVTLPGMVAGGIVGTAVGGPVGTFAGFALPFLNTMAISFGDTVDRNIANGLTGTAAWGEAVIESGLTSAVETALGTVPALGKMLKGVPTAGLAAKTLSALQTKLGKNGAKRFIYNVGKNMLGNSIEEGTEEAIQYLIETAGDAITESIGKDKDFYDTLGNKISAKDWWNNAWQGAVAGLALGAAPAIGDANHSRQYSNLRNAAREGRVFHPAKGVWEILPESANTPNSTEAAAPETAPAQTPAPVQQIADGDFYTPLTQEEKEAVARLDAIETEEGINSEAERLGIKLDPSMHEQGKYDAVRKETIRQIRAAKAQAEAEAATVQTPVTPSNTAVEAAPEIETGGQGTLAFGSAETAPAVAENTADETAPVSAPAVPAVDIPDVQSPMDIAQTEINTQAMENQQIRADEEAEALANEIESEIRQQEEEDAIFDDYESGNYSDNQLAYAPASEANITTPSTAELDAEEKISALKKAESDLNSMRERVAERQGEAPETMESVKISEFDQSKIADKTMQRNLKLAQRIFDALGMGKVVTVETSKEGAFFGVTIRRKNAADNYTFLNMSDIKNNPALLFNRAMHELVHDLIGNNKKAYNELRDKIISPLKGESWFDSSLKEYADGRGFDLSIPEHKAACEEEFICDTVADLMQTEMFWQTLAEKDLPLCKKILEALKDLLTKVQKSFGKVPDKVSAEFTRQLKNRIELAQKFITEASGKSKADLLSAVMPEETTQAASAENAQTTDELFESSEKRKSQNEVPKKGTPKENLEVAPSDNAPQTEQTTEKTSIPSTPSIPSEPQAKETSGEQVSDRKAADYEQRFGTVINTDNAKLLFKDDGYNPHDAESVKKFHSQASAIVRKLFDKFLKERKGKGNGLVVFTGGGNGSGKSSVMADEKIKNSDFVFDSAMVNYEAAKNSIQQVINNGQTPLLAFAYRNPADAWFNGVQKRNQSADGHIVPEGVFANTHAIAKETFLKLVRDFGDKVQYIIKEVADGKVSDISLEELENKPKYTKEQIKESINAENYEKAKSILYGFSNQGTDNQRYSADGRSSRGGNRGVHEESSTGISGTVKPPESTIAKITSSPAGSNTRIMAFTELADGEHTVNGKTFTKKGNAFTLDGKELNAREIEKATRTKTEKIKAKPKAEEKPSDQSEVSDKSERIEDYGEKIGGARKDIIRQYADKINLNGATFAKMFPKPDYAKLLEAGIKIDVLAKLKTSYDMAKVSVKLHKTLDGRQNLTPAKFYASYAKAALLGEDSVDFTAHNWHFTEFGKQTVTIRSKAMEQLFKELGVEYANVDLKGFDIIDTWWKNGVKPEIPKWYGVQSEEWEKRYRVWTVHGSRTGFFDKVEDAIKYYIEVVKKHTTLDQPKYKMKMYKAISGEHSGEHYITAAIRGFGDVPLQYFKTYKEASSYWHDHADDLQHQAAEMEEQKKAERSSKFKSKDKPLRLRFNTETLRDRVGIDYRNGKDVSVKEFSEKFNFRAVEFGNSVSQKERQIALNALYDSLLDLAALLDISPEAISLNGKLAFAYGARGVGNAEAHYEPEKNVINLTKTRGAGNVAHEWWHALDYYFADSKNNPAMDGKYRDDIRPEVKKIFEELQKLFSGNNEYVTRAKRLDAFTKKDYYTQPTEMAARAFTDYVSRQLESQGQVNDFLSNHVSETDWKGEENTYPYPTGDDAVKIGDTFQSLFNTIDEKVDESGNTALFSLIGDQGASRMENAEILLDNLRIAREMTSKGEDTKTIKLATGWEKGGDGKWRMEIPDLKWKTEATLPDGTKYERTPFDMTWTSGKLGDYVNAPELFQAYPELKNIKLDTKILPWEQYGYFDENRNEIVINHEKLAPIAESIDYIEDQKGKDARKKELVKTIENILIHEVQHAIQKIEGFAKGGSLEADKNLSSEAAHKARANSLRKHLADAGFEVSRDEAMLLTDETADDTEAEKLWDKLVDKGMTEEKYDKIFYKIPLFIGYNNLAGEVESRNAVTRSKMTMEERRQSLLDETADVAEEDRIYIMKNAGVSEQAAALRKKGDPNNAEQKGKLIDGNVPHVDGFMQWAKLPAERLYADYEFLYGRHSKYFSSPEETRAAVELVLAKPEQVKDLNGNASFVGFDEETGHIYRIEINKKITGRANHIRSVFEITPQNYNEIKLEPPRVLQPSKTALLKGRAATMTISNFMNKIPPNDSKVNPASEKNPENSSISPITEEEITDLQNNEDTASEIANNSVFSLVTDQKLIDKLDSEEEAGEYMTTYRAMEIGPDGKLHAPMATYIEGKLGPASELGTWEQADERPDLIKVKFKGKDKYIPYVEGMDTSNLTKDKETGELAFYFVLSQKVGTDNTSIDARYNPYMHSATTMLNDQFKKAYRRPNLVVVEYHVPKSELSSGYKAYRAKNSTGLIDWNSGTVQKKLMGGRQVMLSRWGKPIRVVPDSEVAQHIKDLMGGKNVIIPANVVTPSLRSELEKLGVKIDYSTKEYNADKEVSSTDSAFSLTTDLGDTSLSPMDYRRSIDPLFNFVMEYTDNGIVNPGKEHEGEYFTGSFISREYIAYSEKKPQGKNQSDKQYQQYLERREQALDNAEGTPLDEIAAAYVRKFGGDEKEISEQILDMLRDLTKRDLISDRAEAKREVAEHEKEQRKEDKAEYAKMKDAELTKQVNELFESKEPVTVDKRWVQMHREIYPKLYKTVFPNAENVPDIPSSREMAIINQALANGKMDEAAKVAEPLLTDKNLEVKEEADNIEKSIIMRIIELISPKLANSLRDPNEKKDINLVDMLLRPPKWIAEKLKDLPAVQALYQATQDFLDDKAKIANYLNDGLIDKLVNLQKEDKAEYKKCNDYLLKSDRDQTGAGRVKGDKEGLFYIATTADGVSIGSFKTEDEAFDELFKNEHDEIIAKGIMSEKAADAALEFRRAMRRTFVFRRDNIFRTLRQLGFTDVNSTSFIIENPQAYFPDTDITGRVDLFELMREMGQRSGYYVPRIRHGRYMLKATKAGEPTILKGFDTEIGRAWERLKLEKQGYKVKNFLSNTPDQSMMQQVDPAAMMDIMNQAQIRADEKLKNDLTLKEEIYTRKDGTKEKHLVLSPKAKPSTQTVIMLKSIGAKYIDDSWHIINADLQTRANVEEILKGQALHESKLQIAMQSAIGASLVDMLRETGAGSSKIQRRTAKGDDVARGYEEDLIKISGLYINGVSGSTAKNIMAKKMYSAFGGMCFDREKYIADLIPEGLEVGTAEYEKARLNATAEYYKEVSRLAINSAKQPQLAKYFDGYIKEMLRNTTGLERILGGVKGVSAIWLLTRPSSAVSNLVTAVATTPATVHAKTGCGIGFAVKQTGIGAKLYTQYFNWGKYGEGTNLPQQTRELFDIIHKNGWDGAELTQSATQAGLTFAGKAWSKTAYSALWMFSHAEQVNRAAAIYAAYQALVKQRNIDESKLSAMDKYRLLKEAKNISDFGNGVYNKGNRLAITRGGGWGAVVDTGLLFKTFSVNLYNNMYNMLVTGNIKSLAYMTTVLMLAGGASSSIIGTLLASMLGAFSADEGEEKDEAFYRWFADKTYPYFSNIVKYGVPAAININLSGTFRDDIVDAMHDGLPDGNINFTELPAFAIYRNLKNAIEYANSGQSMKAVEQTLPSWGASIARAVREANDGITDRQGKKRKDIHDEYIEADGWDTVARILSFNPVAVSEKTDRIWSEKKVKEKFSEMRKDIVEDYRAIIFDGNPSNEDLADIALRIEEYNAKARRSKRNVPFIDATTLNNAVKDKDNKFLKDDLDEKDKKRIEKKSKSRIVIRNGKLVKE